jgi:cystathionine gamma-lyase
VRSATSFGGVHSSAERRARWGEAVAPGYIRFSAGCEPLEPLWQDVERALQAVPG